MQRFHFVIKQLFWLNRPHRDSNIDRKHEKHSKKDKLKFSNDKECYGNLINIYTLATIIRFSREIII